MTNKKDWGEDILLKLRRQYSKDEAVQAYIHELKKVQFELGQMKSYAAELEYKLIGKDREIEQLKKDVPKQTQKIEQLRRRIEELEDNGILGKLPTHS